MSKKKYLMIFIAGTVLAIACETPTDNQIEQARSCSNSAARMAVTNASGAATYATQTCEPMVSSLTTAEAGRIGFGLVLIEEQLIPAQINSMATALQQNTSAVGSALTFLVFNSNQNAQMNQMNYYANLSGSAGAIKLANIITVANIASQFGSVSSPGSAAAAIGSLIAAGAGAAAQQAQAAQALLSAQQQACAGSGTGTSLCGKLTTAVGTNTSSNTAILQSLQACLSSGAC